MKKIGIYKITNLINGKVYIGQAVDISKRWNQYKGLSCKGQKKLYASFIKYGIENHAFEVLEECEIEILNERERFYQDFYNVLDKGLNLKLTETKDKSGKMSEEFCKKLGEMKKGNKNFLGKKHSDETKKKMSEWQKGIEKSQDAKKNMSNKRKEKFKDGFINPRSKKVINIETMQVYNSGKEAYELNKDFLKIKYFTFAQKLNGHRTNNTIFRYL
jgi:group I intron endonuclease